MIAILIPSRTVEYLERALHSLLHRGFYKLHPSGVRIGPERRIIVGDNGLEYRPKHRAVTYVDVPQPFNFSKAVNLCAAAADPDDDLMVLNDDAKVSYPFFPIEAEHLVRWGLKEGYGLLSPRVNGGVGNHDQAAPTPVGVIRQTFTTICFMSAIIPRVIWDEIGPMDEQFIGYGCEDADYCRRVVEAGYKLGVAGWMEVEHGVPGLVQSGTFRRVFDDAAYSEMGQKAIRIFEAKWGKGPQLGEYAKGADNGTHAR